jgi:hypothetical protein
MKTTLNDMGTWVFTFNDDICAMIWLHTDQLLGDGRDLEMSTSLVPPAQPDIKLLPPPPHQRPVYLHTGVLITPSGPA